MQLQVQRLAGPGRGFDLFLFSSLYGHDVPGDTTRLDTTSLALFLSCVGLEFRCTQRTLSLISRLLTAHRYSLSVLVSSPAVLPSQLQGALSSISAIRVDIFLLHVFLYPLNFVFSNHEPNVNILGGQAQCRGPRDYAPLSKLRTSQHPLVLIY